MQNDDTYATYGYSWIRCTVEEQMVADCLKAGMCDELKLYLDASLEKTEDVVG